MSSDLHRTVMSRTWTDNEPTTLEVAVETDGGTGQAFTVFVSNAAWLDPHASLDVAEWIVKCTKLVHNLNNARPAAGWTPETLDAKIKEYDENGWVT